MSEDVGFDLARHSQVIEWISGKWAQATTIPFQWDRFRQRFAGPGYPSTYRLLDGRATAFRGWQTWRSAAGGIRRRISPKRWALTHFSAALPRDTVIWSKSDDRVLFVAAASQNVILKCGYGDWFQEEAVAEIEAWNRIGSTPLAKHVPSILEHGTHRDDVSWTISELVPHQQSLFFTNSTDRLTELFQSELLTALQSYYEQTSFDLIDRKQWWNRLTFFANTVPPGDPIHQLTNQIEALLAADSSCDFMMPVSIPHGDLKLENIRRDGRKWWLIDWTSRKTMGVIFDVFSDIFYDSYRYADANESKTFWNWLLSSDSATDISVRLKNRIHVWVQWQKSWLGLEVSIDAVRAQLLLMTFEFYTVNRTSRGVTDPHLFRCLQIKRAAL